MKKVYLILFSILVIGLANPSCTKEDDILDDGNARDSFVGEWAVNDACSKQSYRSAISLDNENSTQVIISNYANLGQSATAVIAGNSIYIQNQNIGDGHSANGNGRLNGEVISWSSHNYETEGNYYNCSATYSLVK